MKTVVLSYVFVAVGGALGAMARFSLNVTLQRDTPFPWGTLGANLIGCLVMGVIAYLVAASSWFNEAGIIPDQYRLLFAIGFCGSFTTLSALVMELHTMLQRGELFGSFAYM
ncbi:MAG: CrcB family protein, partial [Gammaproteobacteria bacterium]|nr:CrcB family protein [Gammaproteobacteria bacterium]